MVVAVVLSVPLATAFATGGVDSAVGSSTGGNDVTINKTAAPLYEGKTTVTLEVGAQEKNTAADVVFVLDKSTSVGVKEEALSMLEELWTQVQNENIEVKVGVVTFNNNVNNTEANMPLTTLSESSLESVRDAFSISLSDGTNIEAGIRAGINMLDADDSVLASNKHLVLVTDGVSYLWGTGEPKTVYNEFHHKDNGDVIWSSNSIASGLVDKTALKIADEDYVKSFADPKQWMLENSGIESFAEEYEVAWDINGYDEAMGKYVPKETTSAYCSNDVALYMAGKAWEDAASEGYNLYSFVSDKYNAEDGVLNSEGYYPWAAYFFGNLSVIDGVSQVYHEGAGANYSGMFDGVENTVLYEIQKGTVTDFIGEDFDLTSLVTFKLTVGDETLNAKVIENENKVLFGDNFADERYVVTYYPSKDGSEEYFTWEINVPVEQGKGLKLSYDLTLINRKTEPGDYSVPTNEKAMIEYTPTAGDQGESEFPIPEVKYSVTKPGEDVGNDGVVVDKEANPKDLTNTDKTKVSLSIGATQETTAADVVFVLDKSTSNEVKNEALAMLDELMGHAEEKDLAVNVGVVTFNRTANNQDFNLELTELNQTSYGKIADIFGNKLSGGTNLEAGIRAGIKMLDDDEDVLPKNKHLVLVSDGVTYMWGTEENPQTVYVELSYGKAAASVDYVNNDYPYRDKNNYDEFLNAAQWLEDAKSDGIEDLISEYGTDYTVDYGKVDTYIPADKKSPYTSLETAMYRGGQAWQEAAKKGYQLYAFASDYYVKHGNYPWGPNFIKGLSTIGGVSAFYTDDAANVEGMFDGVENSVLYEIQKGTVTDIIGEQFDLSDKDAITAGTFKLTVGGVEQPSSMDGSDEHKVNFGQAIDGVYPYSVTYSVDENGDEILTWEINVPVEALKGLELSYDLTLVNRSTVPGKHENIPTNKSAILEFEGTDGNGGTEEFPVPVVWYEVDALEATIQPANMTIYMGGDQGYEGVVEDGSDEPIGEANNSLPEPGFYINLPDEVNQALRDSDIVPTGEAADLSGILSIHTRDNTKSWKLVKYGDTHSGAYDRYVYRIEPDTVGQDPVRLQFTADGSGDKFTSDAFDPSEAGALYETYSMDIYRGALEDSEVVIDVTVDGETYTCSMSTIPGTLTIRYVVDNPNSGTSATSNPVTGVVSNIEDADNKGNDAYATIGEGATYYVNESEIDTTAGASPSLLFDSIVSNETGEPESTFDGLLSNGAVNKIAEEDPYFDMQGHESKYLDLVDAANGNAWLTTDSPVTVYWPYPANTGKNTEFHLVHFQGLDRDMANDSIETEIHQTDPDYITVKNTDYGVMFTLQPEKYQINDDGTTVDRVRFSPFVLAWGTSSTPPVTDNEGDLKVSKTVTGNLANSNDEFTFRVTVEGAGTKFYGDVEFTDDVATITLNGGETVTIKNLPKGSKYTVEEIDGLDYELVSSKNTSGTIPFSSVTASFVNDRSEPETFDPTDPVNPGGSKVLLDADGNPVALSGGEFTFKLTGLDGAPMPAGAVDGSITVTNRADGVFVFGDIVFDEAGTYTYELTEVAGTDEGITYDGSTHTLVVVVSDEDADGDGKLDIASLTYDGESTLPTFTNETTSDEPPAPDPDQPGTDEPAEPTTPGVPDTGDHTVSALPAVLALGGVALVGGALAVARRRVR